jgi:hypothetical protein
MPCGWNATLRTQLHGLGALPTTFKRADRAVGRRTVCGVADQDCQRARGQGCRNLCGEGGAPSLLPHQPAVEVADGVVCRQVAKQHGQASRRAGRQAGGRAGRQAAENQRRYSSGATVCCYEFFFCLLSCFRPHVRSARWAVGRPIPYSHVAMRIPPSRICLWSPGTMPLYSERTPSSRATLASVPKVPLQQHADMRQQQSEGQGAPPWLAGGSAAVGSCMNSPHPHTPPSYL